MFHNELCVLCNLSYMITSN
uniref:Uncharacterized protein n=1 Tax=Arundo donax TaxID=35708 RepID=A0A0A9BD06_ARUDO